MRYYTSITKTAFLFGLFFLLTMVSWAQDCPFRARFTVTDATCFNNGKVSYCLLDENNNPISESNLSDYHLRNVRIYSKSNETDSTRYSGVFYKGGVDTLIIDHGTYIIGLEGLCEDGHGGYFKVDTHTVLTINTSYKVPVAAAFSVTATTDNGIGRRPSLTCENTGRIQLKIENGRLPYTVQVIAHETEDVLRTMVFNTHQHEGTDEYQYDYMNYYTIDNMPPGNWDFYVVDGCEYGLPRAAQTVEVVSFPSLDFVELYASSGNMQDSNVIKVNAVLNSPYSYYTSLISGQVKYRFLHEGFADGPWKKFPAVSGTNPNVTLYDTIPNAKFCQIWDKNISLQYQIIGCNDTVITRTFKVYKPNENKYEKHFSDAKDSVISDNAMCTDKWYWHRESYSIRYQAYQPSFVSKNAEHDVYRYHYTHPLTWIYTDLNTGNVIKRDTVSNIGQNSSLLATEVIVLYGALPQTLSVERKLVDGLGCELYSTNDQLQYIRDRAEQEASWQMSSWGNDHCCNVLRSVSVKGNYTGTVSPDGTIVRLVTSPYNNRYNFEAVYHSVSNSWNVTRRHLENVAYINGSEDGQSVELQDYCLPSGPYVFEILTPCDTFRISKKLSFASIYSVELVEDPVYFIEQECTNHYITYTAGQIARISHNTSSTTGLDLTPDTLRLPTSFQVVSGPAGGFDNQWYGLNERIHLSIPGVYVVKISSQTSWDLCETPAFYDTIECENVTVQHLYAYALLCDLSAPTGQVYVKGTSGMEPYSYTLYSKPNKQGEVLGTNTTGVFNNIPMRTDSALSCMIRDVCGANFYVNFYPQLITDLQITWFDDGLKATTTCEGSSVTVHTLQSDNLFRYNWTGPNGFRVNNSAEPTIFIPRGAEDGWYKVTVIERGCGRQIVDSIYLGVKKSPSVKILQNTTVCPGEEVQLTFTPHSDYLADNVNFTIVYETEIGRATRDYAAHSEVSVTDQYIAQLPTKIYPLAIVDDECGYYQADPVDTTYINVNFNFINTCSILTQHDKVCYEETAHLAAKSTMGVPYTLRWYSDLNQTHLLKEEVMTDPNAWSYYDTADITQKALLYVSIDKEGYCPSVSGLATNYVNMHDGSTTLECAQSYRVYDSGGEFGNYGQQEFIKHTFVNSDGQQIALRMIDMDLSTTSHLLVISGSELDMDSVMYDLTNISHVPEIIISQGNTLTLYFMSGMVTAGGWSGLIEHIPGVAIADVYARTHTILYDEVCQSQRTVYENPLHISSEVATLSELNTAVKRAGTHVFSHTYSGADNHHCDSVVTFVLTVQAPPFVDTTVVTSNFLLNGSPYYWHGNQYMETGRYSIVNSMDDGCDSLDILNLIILEIDTTTNEICLDEETTMGIMVTTPRLTWKEGEIPAVKAPGDILCTDGSIIRPDSFLLTNKTAKGVVYYLDRTGLHGKAVALEDAPESYAIWASGPYSLYQSIHAKSFYPTQKDALFDLDGDGNTKVIKQYAEQYAGMEFSYNAPAAYYCYYYDASIRGVNPTESTGWYMPSMGELNLIFGNRVAVNYSLKKLSAIGAEVMDLGQTYYLSSSEVNNSQCWHLDYSGHFASNTKSARHRVRPSINF